MIRKFDEVGRIVIPREFRKELNLTHGSILDIALEDGKIILTPVSNIIECNYCNEQINKTDNYCSNCGILLKKVDNKDLF